MSVWHSRGLVILAVVAAVGCSGDKGGSPVDPGKPQPSTVPDTLVHDSATILSGNFTRAYLVRVPAGWHTRSYPLVIALHEYGSSAAAFMATTGFTTMAERDSFAVVFPYARNTVWSVNGFNNADDVKFISDVIDELVLKYSLAAKRVYVTGMSNGGSMAYRLAAELSTKVTAIAPVSASLAWLPAVRPPQEVAILHIHALDDTSMPFTGSTEFLPVPLILERWQQWQSAGGEPTVVVNQGGVLGKRWHSATGRGDVELYTTQTGGHSWPTLANSGLNASAEIWSFFKVQSR